MIELCVLGTGAMMPMPDRRLASVILRIGGRNLLIDCGEGTQVAVRESGFSLARIDLIFITHFHADHVAGLPGLLLTMGTSGRADRVTIVGPKGIAKVVNALRVIAPELPYPIEFIELDGAECAFPFQSAELAAFRVDHLIPCYGLSLRLKRPGQFLVERARDIPKKHWNALQSGQAVSEGGRVYTPDMVLGPERRGLKFTYATDTRNTDAIARFGQGADLMLLEGTYSDDDKAEKAREFGHMTFRQAAALARRAEAKALMLTHFSPSVRDPEQGLPAAREIFLDTRTARDGEKLALRFS